MKALGTVAAVSLLLLLVLSGSGVASGDPGWNVQGRCHSSDHAALVAIGAALGGDYASWLPAKNYSCCDLFAVECDLVTSRVIGFALRQQLHLTATIPGDAIAGLVHLQTLELHHLPGLSGPIPPAIASLSNLSTIQISWTAVSGPVPSFLGALTKLAYLDLSFNSLSGAIPPSLAAHPTLYGIDLSRNRLTGAIPPLLSASSRPISTGDQQLGYLDLSHNNLSGAVPAGLAAAGIAHIDLSRNAFTGDVASALFGRGKELLQYLDLSRNAFAFNLSAYADHLPEHLYLLDLSHNAIYGGIPAQLLNLTSLYRFNVSYNRLCGAVPTGGNMATLFDAYSFQHNKCLCGTPLPNPCTNSTHHQLS